jgi:hypothetical protein
VELRKLQRYEGHLGRELSRLFKHFHHLQDLRRQAPDPAATAPPPPDASPASGSHVENNETNSPSGPAPRKEAGSTPPRALTETKSAPARSTSRPAGARANWWARGEAGSIPVSPPAAVQRAAGLPQPRRVTTERAPVGCVYGQRGEDDLLAGCRSYATGVSSC